MPGKTTIPIDSDPLSRRAKDSEATVLVIAWCAGEPRRAGEIAVLAQSRADLVLGRGDDAAGGRVRFFRQRPGKLTPTAPLESPSLSRQQLVIRGKGGDLFEVERVGGGEMRVNGVACDRATVSPGDVIHVKRVLVLLCAKRAALMSPLRHFPREAMGDFGAPDAAGILGESPPTWRLRESVAFAALTGTHALVTGESGTGKELAARAIHRLSKRASGPFVARSAATLPAGLIDAELFGNAKSYPNAGMPERPGLIGQANGGTLFLDEIGELPSELQAHLLRALDADGEYQRLGESQARKSDFRLVAATNRDPRALKHDVLARLASRVEVTSLAERKEDVPLLASHLVLRAAEKSPEVASRFVADGAAYARLDAFLVEHLLLREFPANVRELEALLWRAMGESEAEVVTLAHEDRDGVRASAPSSARENERASNPQPEPRSGEEPTADAIRAALESSKGSVTHAARSLGMTSRYALYRLMKKNGIAGVEE